MLRFALLGTALAFSAPVVAQTAPAQDMTPPASQPGTAPTQQATPMSPQTVPVEPSTVDPATTPAQTADTTAQSDPAAQAAPAAQVADIVTKEFPSYDKNGDGKLSQTEFGSWMVALKTASDPTTKATAPATKTWIGQAFAQADTDKNKSVTKAELTGFLGQG